MYSATHRLNHDFQLQYFMANHCHTPDAAYALLYAQKVDMESKVKHGEAQKLRRQIARAKAQAVLEDAYASEIDKMEARADLLEQESSDYTWEMNFEGAKQELATIERLMAELEPLRKYAHLPILEANEACQREELLHELKCRAENFLMTQGTIPADQLDTMRCHPDFRQEILPHIAMISAIIRNGGDLGLVFDRVEKPKLLTGD